MGSDPSSPTNNHHVVIVMDIFNLTRSVRELLEFLWMDEYLVNNWKECVIALCFLHIRDRDGDHGTFNIVQILF